MTVADKRKPGNPMDGFRRAIRKQIADKRLKAKTGLSLDDLDDLPPMAFEDFCAYLDRAVEGK